MKSHSSTIILGSSLLIISILSLFVGVIDIDLNSLISVGNGMELKIFLISRIPRLLAILCTGAGMSVAGLIMQKLCMNKFVSPSTGATIQSAQFGILLSMVFIPSIGLRGRVMLAFFMSILGTLIFVWFTQKIHFKNTVLVPLIGIMFGNILGGITSFIAYKFEVTQQLSAYFVGSFALIIKGNYELVWLVVPLVIIAFIFANYFNIVGMGKDFSQNLGVNYKIVLFFGLMIASMITASVVTIVGQISYVGLIIPNIVAMFKGDKIKGTLVDTALLGALFVLICDMLARSVIMPYELPIELIIGIIGSVMFIAMLVYKLGYVRKDIHLRKANIRKLVILTFVVIGVCAAYLLINSYPENPKLFQYILSLRVPTLIVMVIAAFSIGSASIIFQSIINNRIVTPCLLGMNTMYTLVHTAVIFVVGSGSVFAVNSNLSFAIDLIVMSITATFVYSYMFKKTGNNVLYVLLIGTVLSSFFGSIQSTMIRVMDPNEYDTLLATLVADFNNINVEVIIFSLILLTVLTIVLWKDLMLLDVITLGKDQATNLGVDYDHTVRRLLLGVVFCIAVATAMVGPISFLGLIIANLARQFLKTYKHSQLIWGSALIGMLTMIAGQLVSQHVFSYAVPISTFITIGGGIYFLYLLLFKKGGI